MKLTIGKRIGVGFATLIVLTGVLGWFGSSRLAGLGREAVMVADVNLPSVYVTDQLQLQVAQNVGRTFRSILLKDEATLNRIKGEINECSNQHVEGLKQYERLIHSDRERALYEDVTSARHAYTAARDRVVALSVANKDQEAAVTSEAVFVPAYEKYMATIQALGDYNKASSEVASATIKSTVKTSQAVLYGGLGAAVVLGVGIAWMIVRSTTKVLTRLARTLEDNAQQLTGASGQVASASQSLAEGASKQAASLEETSAALEEVASMTRQNAETAGKANSLAAEAKGTADAGGRAMERMGEAIKEIEKSAAETAKIIKVIDEIAFQTNLLALNAAVEARGPGRRARGLRWWRRRFGTWRSGVRRRRSGRRG